MKTEPNLIDTSDLENVAVISAKISTFRALPEGVVRMMIEVDPDCNEMALCWFSETGSTVAIARLKSDNPED